MLPISTEPMQIRTSKIIDSKGDGPWYEALFSDGRNNVGLICDTPGSVNDDHYHPDFNEFWIILKGSLEYEIGDFPTIHAHKGDVVLAPAGE